MGSSLAQVQPPQSSSSGKSGMVSQIADQATAPTTATPNPSVPNVQPSFGKGSGMQGSQGAVTFPGQGAQPEMGMPNAYSNTINPQPVQQSSWDNSSNPSGKGSAGSAGSSGKGKGA